jgi:hypothetical protein
MFDWKVTVTVHQHYCTGRRPNNNRAAYSNVHNTLARMERQAQLLRNSPKKYMTRAWLLYRNKLKNWFVCFLWKLLFGLFFEKI